MKKFTKKLGGKRCMKKMPEWYGVHKTTPEAWFLRWEEFTTRLLLELGFAKTGEDSISKPRGKTWQQFLWFQHPVLGSYTFSLMRERRQEGGNILVICGDKNFMVETISYNAYPIMCRTTVGDKILEIIRTNWESQNLESKPNEDS